MLFTKAPDESHIAEHMEVQGNHQLLRSKYLNNMGYWYALHIMDKDTRFFKHL